MKYVITLNGKNYEVVVEEKNGSASAAPAAPVAPAVEGAEVIAPMPGTILSVSAAAGQAVKAGDVLMILEAMKMENEIVAPCDGTVKMVSVQKGSTIQTDAVLAVIG